MSAVFCFAAVVSDTQTLMFQTVDQRPVKCISEFGPRPTTRKVHSDLLPTSLKFYRVNKFGIRPRFSIPPLLSLPRFETERHIGTINDALGASAVIGLYPFTFGTVRSTNSENCGLIGSP